MLPYVVGRVPPGTGFPPLCLLVGAPQALEVPSQVHELSILIM
jgi:hypothetical protein